MNIRLNLSMKIEKIIVLDDELMIRKSLQEQLRKRRCCVAACSTLEQVYALLAKDHFDLIFADVCLPDGEGVDLLQRLSSSAHSPLVIMMTGCASVESAVKCMQLGAFDYIMKPFSMENIEAVLKKAQAAAPARQTSRHVAQELQKKSHLIGESDTINQLRALIAKVSATEATVMITGENGTGKEEVASEIFRLGPLSSQPFIKVNCAALSETLIESELFGHEKGAFTGATHTREGRFELAHKGTLLLDEIGEISPRVQAKLLRVLQEGEFERVGGNQTQHVCVRVIASTNRDLKKAVELNEFREDLYYRLNVFPIHVAPLRERGKDVLILAEHFLKIFCNKHHKTLLGFSSEALQSLLDYPWPGNIRELQNTLERAVILCESEKRIEAPTLGLIPAAPSAPHPIKSLEDLEREHILAVLHQTGGSLQQTAELLKVNLRTLRTKLKQHAPV